MIRRAVDLARLLAKKSYFLLGPRQTGKSFLVRRTLPDVRLDELLDSATYLALSRNPGRIAEEITDRDRIVVIDQPDRRKRQRVCCCGHRPGRTRRANCEGS